MIKVLVVDDDKLARKGLISLMDWGKYGMQVVGSVQNGKLALEFVQSQPVDLAFVDIDMPEMSGLEFMEQCHQLNSEVQFVVISFYERFDYVQSTLRLGGLDYISKTSMDLENCDEVLRRIRTKYDEKKGRISAAPQESNRKDTAFSQEDAAEKVLVSANEPAAVDAWHEGTAINELRKQWKSMHWFFDDQNWEKMKEQMATCQISVRRIELIVSGSVGELEDLLGVEERGFPLFGSMDELIGWVEKYRSELLEMAWTLSLENDIQRIANTVSYMRKNFQSDILTTEAAARIGVSRSYFCTVFKKWVGISFGDYLQQLRIDGAKKMLKGSNLPVSDIAFHCGYNDIYYFSRVFRKATGCTPADYRGRKPKNPGKN